MRSKKHLILTLLVFILLAALYRVLPAPYRQPGFAPHLAMALFAGAMIKDRMLAIAFPLLSMLISDVLYHLLYINGLTDMQGFYAGQVTNYILIGAMTVIGFFMKKVNVLTVGVHSVLIAVSYYLLSNFFVWNSGGGYGRPHTFDGLIMCYMDALPFLQWSLVSTLLFSGILFGGWKLMESKNQLAAG